MGKKKEWEIKYEKYVQPSNELDLRIAELEKKAKGEKPKTRTVEFKIDEEVQKVKVEKGFKYTVRHLSKEEYKEYNKLIDIKGNLPKVKNIMELRKKLYEQIEEIRNELKARNQSGKNDKEIERLETEMTELENENKQIQSQIKENGLTPELSKKLKQNATKRQENNRKFGDCMEAKDSQKINNGKLKDIKTEDLEKQLNQLYPNIGKCNLACTLLMNGDSWKAVEVALDRKEVERLTAKGENAQKIKNIKESSRVEEQENIKNEPVKEEVEKVLEESTRHEEIEENLNTSIAEVSRWQKIKNWFKTKVNGKESSENTDNEKTTMWQRFKNWIKREEEPVKKEPVKEEPVKEEPVKEEPVSQKDTFRQYLRDVAEKGIDGAENDKKAEELAEKEAKRQAAIEKLKANRVGNDTGAIVTELDKKLYQPENDGR